MCAVPGCSGAIIDKEELEGVWAGPGCYEAELYQDVMHPGTDLNWGCY